jgi:DNA-directed RNA polymerase specialized sigma24 family protein
MAYDPSSSDPPAPGRPDEEILSAERLESLREILDMLPDNLRRCFLLRHARGYSEDEIAVLMKLSIDRVRTCLWQARRMLGVGGSGEIS